MYTIQYNRKTRFLHVLILMISAFLIQEWKIRLLMPDFNETHSFYDYYLLSGVDAGDNTPDIAAVWFLPILNGILLGRQFGCYTPIAGKIFQRADQKKFIQKNMSVAFWSAVLYSLLFYGTAWIAMTVTLKTAVPDMPMHVSMGRNVAWRNVYFAHPFLYVLYYVISLSLFEGAFLLIGYHLSLKIRLTTLIPLVPFLFLMLSSLVFQAIPKVGIYLSYNVLSDMKPPVLHRKTAFILAMVVPVCLILIERYRIRKTSCRDLRNI